MLSKKLLDEINTQIKLELDSGYLYLAMSAWFETQNLPGFAAWMRKQAGEEQEHALKFFDHVNERGAAVVLKGLDQPPATFKSPLAVFEQTLAHEQGVTARINLLYKIATEEADYASQGFLSWFVKEQVEEEKNATFILERLKVVKENSNGLFMLDSVLGKRGG